MCFIFLGITLDTVKMEARPPQEKLLRCLALVRQFQAEQKDHGTAT